MADIVEKLFLDFATGEIDFATLQKELTLTLQLNPDLAQNAAAIVQEMDQEGRLPPQLYQLLNASCTPSAPMEQI